ncbi:MAG: class I SAM-dependent methyltransferase [Deltaproteobacteria bacterium]|nr:class I SAM-dependent methyltransferase [Deltaproteobacteria bacterium]
MEIDGVHGDRRQWEQRLEGVGDPNEVFFAWYDTTRLRWYGPRRQGLSLEIGPGSGHFTAEARIAVAVDVSHANLLTLREKTGCCCVVADAARLPFRDGSFAVVYTNDVVHHLKAQGVLEPAAHEVYRVLKNAGAWCVSDRLPSFYNSLTLALSAGGRKIFLALASLLRHVPVLSGSDDEPPLTPDDYAVLERDMEVISKKPWRGWLVFWVYGGCQFLRLVLPRQSAFRLASRAVALLETMEQATPKSLKCDVCLTMIKRLKHADS